MTMAATKEPNKIDLGGILSSLATGDNFSKLLMVVIVLLTGGGIWNVNREGKETRAEMNQDFLRAQKKARAQVHVIYENQNAFINALKAERDDHNKMMQKFGLGMSQIKDIPIMPEPTPDEDEH